MSYCDILQRMVGYLRAQLPLMTKVHIFRLPRAHFASTPIYRPEMLKYG